jgi:hypothetical protein
MGVSVNIQRSQVEWQVVMECDNNNKSTFNRYSLRTYEFEQETIVNLPVYTGTGGAFMKYLR